MITVELQEHNKAKGKNRHSTSKSDLNFLALNVTFLEAKVLLNKLIHEGVRYCAFPCNLQCLTNKIAPSHK